MAIGIKLKKAKRNFDPSSSKFFGSPTFPKGLIDRLNDDTVFIAQIRLEDIKEYDKENILPHTGYLYFFLETSDDSPYTEKKGSVIYTKEEIEVIYDDFNKVSPISEGLNEDYLIEFFECDDSYTGIKLLGYPSGVDDIDDNKKLLLQFDPLDTDDLDIFPTMDGYIYYFYKNINEEHIDIIIQFDYS